MSSSDSTRINSRHGQPAVPRTITVSLNRKLTLLGLLLLLLGSGLGTTGSGTTSGSGTGTSGGGGTTTSSDVGEHGLDVLALEGLGEEGSPDGLDLDRSGGGDGGDLVGLRAFPNVLNRAMASRATIHHADETETPKKQRKHKGKDRMR